MPDTNPTESDMQAIADQLHALAVKCESLTQRLENMTRQRDDAAVALLNAGQKHDADRIEWRAEFNRLLGRANEAAHDATRSRNRLVMIASTAHEALADFLETYSPFELSAFTPEWRQRVKAAREMVKLIEAECT